MQNIENVVEYLAKHIDATQLPCLSGDDVSFELELCTSIWYEYCDGSLFYNDMVKGYTYQNVQQSPYLPREAPTRKSKRNSRTSPYNKSETVSKEELEAFRLELKTHRIRLGLTQAQAAKSIGKVTNRRTSQTSLCRFENNQLHIRNMFTLCIHFKQWVVTTQSC